MTATSEDQDVETLQNLGLGKSADTIRDVLRKHNGDLNAAASALMMDTEDSGMHDMPPLERYSSSNNENVPGALNSRTYPFVTEFGAPPPTPRVSPQPNKSQPTIIDLTGDDDDEELQKALNLSVQQSNSSTALQPSKHFEPKQSWALVPVTSKQDTNAQDNDLQRAMDASILSSYQNSSQDVWLPDRVRIDRTLTPVAGVPTSEWAPPVALRTSDARFMYGALLMQALYSIPQLRHWLREAALDDPSSSISTTAGDYEELRRFFCILDFTQHAHLDVSNSLLSLLGPTSPRLQKPEAHSRALLEKICATIDDSLAEYSTEDKPYPRPFSMCLHNSGRTIRNLRLILTSSRNDIVSCLDHFFLESKADPETGRGESISSPAEVLAIRLFRDPHQSNSKSGSTKLVSGGGNDVEPFRFPLVLQMDRWMTENAAVTHEAHRRMKALTESVHELESKIDKLTSYNGKDNLETLRGALHYIENIASRDSEERISAHDQAAAKIHKIIQRVEQEITSTKESIKMCFEERASLFGDGTGEPKYEYHLRAVLMHDGLYGVRNSYAYVQSPGGEWWKSVYDNATRVPAETVCSDAAGLHMNSGPYLLFYSRVVQGNPPTSKPAEYYPGYPWPRDFIDRIRDDNAQLRGRVGNQISADLLSIEALERCDPLYDPLAPPPVVASSSGSDHNMPTVQPFEIVDDIDNSPVPSPQVSDTGIFDEEMEDGNAKTARRSSNM